MYELLKNWIAEYVASEVYDFNTDHKCHMLSIVNVNQVSSSDHELGIRPIRVK